MQHTTTVRIFNRLANIDEPTEQLAKLEAAAVRLVCILVTAALGSIRAAQAGIRLSGRIEDGRLVPDRDRAEIEDGALAGQGLELVWVDDPVDAFLLHVQGSGRVILPDGEVLRVGFAATNGLPFTAIGQVLLDEGKVAPGEASIVR